MKHASTILAIIIGIGIVYAWDWFDRAARNAEPPENWYVVRNIYVADFEEGNTQAPVIYDREIRRPFFGEWIVEIHPVGRQENACPGSTGKSHYEPKDELPASGVTLDWYLGKPCALRAGQYVMRTYWKIQAANYPQKEVTFTSNVFSVYPKGAQIYITPEQSMKLQSIAP